MVSACGTGGPTTVSLPARESRLEHSDRGLWGVPVAAALGRMTGPGERGNCAGHSQALGKVGLQVLSYEAG